MPLPPPRVIAGSRFADAWNKMREAVRGHAPLQSRGMRTHDLVHGVIREPEDGDPPYGEESAAAFSATYRVKSVPADVDYLLARTWDGTNEGSEDVKIAKNFNCRQPAAETLAGLAFAYTYSAGPDALNQYRRAVATGIDENQIVTPLWTVDGLIQVNAISFSGVTVSGSDLKLIEVSSRCWAKV